MRVPHPVTAPAPARSFVRAALLPLRCRSYTVVVSDLREAAEISDRLAIEHVELHVANATALGKTLKHYGGLFVGGGAAEVLGDYGAGPNHTLPTGGTARSTGGLSVLTFLRVRTWMRVDDPLEAAQMTRDAVRLGQMEGLIGHANAARARLLSGAEAEARAIVKVPHGISTKAKGVTERLLFGLPKKGRIHEKCLKFLEAAGLEYTRPEVRPRAARAARAPPPPAHLGPGRTRAAWAADWRAYAAYVPHCAANVSHIHVAYMSHTCMSHVCRIHVAYMSHTCMSHTCRIHVAYMSQMSHAPPACRGPRRATLPWLPLCMRRCADCMAPPPLAPASRLPMRPHLTCAACLGVRGLRGVVFVFSRCSVWTWRW